MLIKVTFSTLRVDEGLGRCSKDWSVALNVRNGMLFNSFHVFLLGYSQEKLWIHCLEDLRLNLWAVSRSTFLAIPRNVLWWWWSWEIRNFACFKGGMQHTNRIQLVELWQVGHCWCLVKVLLQKRRCVTTAVLNAAVPLLMIYHPYQMTYAFLVGVCLALHCTVPFV